MQPPNHWTEASLRIQETIDYRVRHPLEGKTIQVDLIYANTERRRLKFQVDPNEGMNGPIPFNLVEKIRALNARSTIDPMWSKYYENGIQGEGPPRSD